jgi:SAM-dependent methyltransferase
MAGRSDGELLHQLAVSEQHANYVLGGLVFDWPAEDTQWIGYLYERLLGRPPDPGGAAHYAAQLTAGVSRRDLARFVIASEEYVRRVSAAAWELPDLRVTNPDRYVEVRANDGSDFTLLRCPQREDFDWIEGKILDNNFYDKPGVWSYLPGQDKEVMAELIGGLQPATVLEIGCSTGTVLSYLSDAGVWAEGVEISESTMAKADPGIRNRIHLGDILALDLPRNYDVVFGLDVFEHLNPNRLTSYLEKLTALIRPGGFLLANIPVFGQDRVFGCSFDLSVLPAWEKDSEAGRPFSLLPVDVRGYPEHGHLILADSDWWVGEFEKTGLTRQPELERAFHERYDSFWADAGPGRRLFYLFSLGREPVDIKSLTTEIRSTPSRVLSAPASRQ